MKLDLSQQSIVIDRTNRWQKVNEYTLNSMRRKRYQSDRLTMFYVNCDSLSQPMAEKKYHTTTILGTIEAKPTDGNNQPSNTHTNGLVFVSIFDQKSSDSQETITHATRCRQSVTNDVETKSTEYET